MKAKIFLTIVFILIGFVSAQDIPPAPAPDPLVRIVSCSDTDGGINYYTPGVFIFNVIKWTDNSPSFRPPENTGYTRDYCKGEQIDCNHPEKNILVESFCTNDEINLVKENAISHEEYDCSSEDKVCYDGACVSKVDLEKNPKYSKEKEECKQQMKEFKQSLSFWQRISFWFKDLLR